MTQARSAIDSLSPKLAFLPTPIVLSNSQVMTGANVYHTKTVIAQSVDFGVLSKITTAMVGEEFAQRFLNRFCTLQTFVKHSGVANDFIEALQSNAGASFQQTLLEAILAVESAVAFASHELRTVSHASIHLGKETKALLVWDCLTRPHLSEEAAKVALLGISELLPQIFKSPALDTLQGIDFNTSLASLCERARRRRMSPSTAVIKYTAEMNNIPAQLLDRQHLLLGEGVNQQQFYASMTGSTSIAAQKMCADKRQTNKQLKKMRLPVAKQFKLGSLAESEKATEKCGLPVVVKPNRGRKGKGISIDVQSVTALETAFLAAHSKGKDVIVEEYIPGVDCRLLVVHGKFVAAVQRHPPSIVGDGLSTIQTLIDNLNKDPYRDGFRGFKVELESDVLQQLEKAGFALSDIPAEGEKIVLRAVANVSTGGIPEDVTELVHPDNREMAIRAAASVGLDVAGVDVITEDISKSYKETNTKIIEVNARPGLDIHIWPKLGLSRNVALDLLKVHFAKNNQGRIPVLGIAGDNGIGSAARCLDMIVRGANRKTALTLHNSSYLDGQSAEFSESQQEKASDILLSDPEVETLIKTVSLRDTARRGLQFDHCSVAVIMDRVRSGGANAFNKGMDVVIQAATKGLVVGAGNIVAMNKIAKLAPSKKLVLISEKANNPALLSHLKKGGDAVTRLWHNGEHYIAVLSGDKILATLPFVVSTRQDSKARAKRLNIALMYAVGAAYASGLSVTQITQALENPPEIVEEETD